ncbi:putative signal transducing protein [Tindallia californiensis]|uniref:Putative signal transducing protein n=1 Tax=Tindallia californiensis TaxID=159292 RepID=A0A1H3QNQ5_9FIRM|nr:DUF2007 domain-containing protein [Tindallia californiensis]SDZ14923.1 Putative signal transducing protein [Tindallia californiensis]
MEKEALLTVVSNEIEAGMVESLLAPENIPVLRKQRGAGQYMEIYMGMSMEGVELYVPVESLEKARELIRVQETGEPLEEPQSDEELVQAEEDQEKKRRRRSWIILLLVFPGILWLLIHHLGNLLRILFQ